MKIESSITNNHFLPLGKEQMGLPLKGLICSKEMLPYLPIKRSTLWKWTKDGRFPTPVKVSKLTRWQCTEVHEWLKQFEKPTTSVQGGGYVS